MKKTIVDYRQIIVLDGEEFDTSCKRHLSYDVPKETILKIDTFDRLLELIEKDCIFNARIELSMFKKEKIAILYKADLYDFKKVINRKTFKPFTIKCVNEIDTRHNSFKTLMELLEAEDFTEWCKDQGITTIYS